jgi:tripartite-type tricarboxylate transporter receptor subunit TctC
MSKQGAGKMIKLVSAFTRGFGQVALALGLACATAAAMAQTYPDKAIRMIVPFPPGATTDKVGRLMGQELSKRLKQPVVVQNVGGAGGAIGTRQVIGAPADGYTLLTTTSAVMTVASQVSEAKFDPEKELVPIAFVGEAFSVIAVNPELPIHNLAELMDYAAKNPGKFNYGSAGYGSMGNIHFELLKYLTNLQVSHVPYRGGGPAITAAIAGEVQAVFDPAAMPLAQAGRLRPIAVHGPSRWSALPGVPTIAESGVRNWDLPIWYGLVAAAGTPPEIVAAVSRAWNEAMDDPAVQRQLEQVGISPRKESPEQLGTRISADLARIRGLLPKLRITQ